MGYDDLVDCSCFISAAIGEMGHSVGQASHAIGQLSKALGGCGHAEGVYTKACNEHSCAEGCSSLSSRQPTVVLSRTSVRPSTIVKMSIVRESSLPERQTTKVLEKNFGPFNKGDIIFHKDGWNFN